MIFLVDASVYVFRAWHSVLPEMRDRDGNPAHAVFGFARFLGDLIERVRPTYMAVAFDQRRAGSYRNRIYPAYKANRERAPADLALQFEHCREVCRRLGLAVFVDPDYEADDIIGTLAALMREQGVRSAFITRDKDLAQLVRNGDLFWDFGAREQFGYHDIERHFGVRPERFADYLALTGDEVDNIPGVPGIGHRTAASLMHAFSSLDELYADLARVAAPQRASRVGVPRAAAHAHRLRSAARRRSPRAPTPGAGHAGAGRAVRQTRLRTLPAPPGRAAGATARRLKIGARRGVRHGALCGHRP